MNKLNICLVLLFLQAFCTVAQDKIPETHQDSLMSEIFLYIRADEFLKAFNTNEELRYYALKQKDTFSLANSYNLEGILEGATGNYENSEKAFFKTIELYEKIGEELKVAKAKSNLFRSRRSQNKTQGDYTMLIDATAQLKKSKSFNYFRTQFYLIDCLFEDGKYEEVLENTQQWLDFFETFDFSTGDPIRAKDLAENLSPKCLALKGYALIELGKHKEGYALLKSNDIKEYLFRENGIDPLKQDKEISDFYSYKTKCFIESSRNIDSISANFNLFNKYNDIYFKTFQSKFKARLSDLSNTKEVNLVKEKNDELTKKNSIILIISGVFMLVLLALLSILYRANLKIKESSKTLRRQNLELHKIDDERNQFFSVLTHELRTPIYSVKGLIRVISDEFKLGNITYKNPKVQTYYNSLNILGEHLYTLTNNILLYTKFNLGETSIKKNNVRLREFITKTVQPFTIENKIIIEVEDSVTDFVIIDQIKLRQVLVNLVSNAIKYSNKKPIYIKVKTLNENEDSCNLRFSVIDHGIGISKDRFQYLFNAFNKGDVNLDQGIGTGLGLFIISNILKLYNSKIELTSELGKGSDFSFNLELEKHIKKEKSVVYTIEGLKLLVVDDNDINLMISQKIIEKANGICETTNNGLEAIEKVKNEEFDLVLMDVHMPKINGVEATRRIREFNKEIPIIALTAVDFESNKNAILESGMNDIVSKPFNENYLFEKIHFLCKK